jgi:hypothetical protein
MSVVDQTKTITVQEVPVLPPAAVFNTLLVVVNTPGGASTTFDILAGQSPSAHPGDSVYVLAMITNNGTTGTIWVTITYGGTVLWTWSGSVDSGQSSGSSSYLVGGVNPFTMPSAAATVTAQCGH